LSRHAISFARGAIVAAFFALAASAAAQDAPYDAVVVGSGPGGLVAALSARDALARTPEFQAAGREPRVLVIESRNDHDDENTLGDDAAVQGTAFARQQVIGVKPAVVNDLARLGFRIPDRFLVRESTMVQSGAAVSGDSEGVASDNPAHEMFEQSSTHVIPINTLQHLLARHARQIGIEIRNGTAVRGIAPGRQEASIAIERRSDAARATLRARWVIGADGAGSAVRQAVGLRQTTVERQGTMVGAWFDGVPNGNRMIYTSGVEAGASGVILGSERNQYGLFALPPHLARLVDDARASRRELTAHENRQISEHVREVASSLVRGASAQTPALVNASIRVSRVLPFQVSLERVNRTVSMGHRTTLVGDAVQTVNPYTGMGANIAMKAGFEAGRAVAATLSGQPMAMHRYNRIALQMTTAIHVRSRAYTTAFQARSQSRVEAAPRRPVDPARALAPRARLSAPPGSPLGNARSGLGNTPSRNVGASTALRPRGFTPSRR
jgi:2-polyprenyl-6-methoxyphenol hydroxylase-like FAD-dependent oxidoreductase